MEIWPTSEPTEGTWSKRRGTMFSPLVGRPNLDWVDDLDGGIDRDLVEQSLRLVNQLVSIVTHFMLTVG